MNGASTASDITDGPAPAFDLEAERGYWKKLEKVEVSLVSQKEGWFLQKYTVESDVSVNSRLGTILIHYRNAQVVPSPGGILTLCGFSIVCSSAMYVRSG